MKLTDFAEERMHRVEVPASFIHLLKSIGFLNLEKQYLNSNIGIVFDRKVGSSSITYSTPWEPINEEHSYVDEDGEAQSFEHLVDHEIDEYAFKTNAQKATFIFNLISALNFPAKVWINNDIREQSEIIKHTYISKKDMEFFLLDLKGQEAAWAKEWYESLDENKNGFVFGQAKIKGYLEDDLIYEKIKDVNSFEEFENLKKESFFAKLNSGMVFNLNPIWENKNKQIDSKFDELQEAINNLVLVITTFKVELFKKEQVDGLNVKAFAELFNKRVCDCFLGADFLEKNGLFNLSKLRFEPEVIGLKNHLTPDGFVNYVKYLSKNNLGFNGKNNNTKDVLKAVQWIKNGIEFFDLSVEHKMEIKETQKEMSEKLGKLIGLAINSVPLSEDKALMEVLALQVSLPFVELDGAKSEINSSLLRL